MARILTKEQAEWAFNQVYNYGRTYKEIGELFHVDRSTVSRAIRAYGYDNQLKKPDLIYTPQAGFDYVNFLVKQVQDNVNTIKEQFEVMERYRTEAQDFERLFYKACKELEACSMYDAEHWMKIFKEDETE